MDACPTRLSLTPTDQEHLTFTFTLPTIQPYGHKYKVQYLLDFASTEERLIWFKIRGV